MPSFSDYYQQGQEGKPAILLMHSLSDSHAIMQPLADKLNEAGYSVLCPDFTSHAEGDMKEVMATDFSSYQADGEDFLAWLQDQGHEDIVVGGMSLGGLVAFDLASRHEDLTALISIATPIFTDLTETPVPRFIRQRYYLSLDSAPTKEIRDQSQPLFDGFIEKLESFNDWMDDVFPKIRQLTLPVFIAQGEQDEIVPDGVAQRLCRVLSESDQLEYCSFEMGSHYLTEEESFDELLRGILEFLAKL